MNLTQIKAVYTSNLNERLSHCFANIENEMVVNFHKVQQGIDFTITEVSVSQYSNGFPSDCKNDLIKEIKQRYADNWDITYVPVNKRENSHFVFHYIGEQADFAAHIVHRDTIIVNKDEPIESRNRILDL